MKFKTNKEKLKVNEIMADLLLPLENHMDEETICAVETALQILQETEVEK